MNPATNTPLTPQPEPSQTLNFVHLFVPGPEADSAPVLLLLHGTGGTESDLLELGRTLYPGASLLSPRGKILENGMPRFFRRLAEGVFDEEDLIFRTHELADFVEAAEEHYRFNRNKVIAVGYSNGANIAASTLLLRPGTLSAAVLLRAMVPLTPAIPPNLSGVPVLLASGKADSMIPARSAEQLAAMLREAGAEVTQTWIPGGHQLTSPEIEEAQRWLSAHA